MANASLSTTGIVGEVSVPIRSRSIFDAAASQPTHVTRYQDQTCRSDAEPTQHAMAVMNIYFGVNTWLWHGRHGRWEKSDQLNPRSEVKIRGCDIYNVTSNGSGNSLQKGVEASRLQQVTVYGEYSEEGKRR